MVGTTATSFEYDGLSRLTHATDNNEPGEAGDDSAITYAYDSLSRVIEETQRIGGLPAKAISSAWRAEALHSGLTYPNGRVLDYTYDHLNRLNTVADDGAAQPIADYDYIGGWRVLQRRYPINNTRLTFLDNAGTADVGYDGLRRPAQLRHLRGPKKLIAGFTHTYDRMDNKLTEKKLHDPRDSELYGYDSAYRLIHFDRGRLNRTNDGILRPSRNVPLHSDWTLDGVGNWTQVDGETHEVRQHSSFNELIQRQSVVTPSNDDDDEGDDDKHSHGHGDKGEGQEDHDEHGGGAIAILYDDNGNEIDDGTYRFAWDAMNRLRTVTRKSDGTLIAVYAYDAAGRRIRKVVTNSGALNGTTNFYLDGWQEIEEHNASNNVIQQYVYGGVYIDEPLVLDRNLNSDATATGPGDQRLFYHQNTLFSVFALTSITGTLVERYQYDAYGRQTVFAPGANGIVDWGGDDMVMVGGVSGVGNPYMFTGRRLDGETGLYYYRTRYEAPGLGRFLGRDPLSNIANRGSMYAYVGNNSVNAADPFGMKECKSTGVFVETPWMPIVGSKADGIKVANAAIKVARDVGEKECRKRCNNQSCPKDQFCSLVGVGDPKPYQAHPSDNAADWTGHG